MPVSERVEKQATNYVRMSDEEFSRSVGGTVALIDPSGRIKTAHSPKGWAVNMKDRVLFYNREYNGRPLTANEVLYLVFHEGGHLLYSKKCPMPKDVGPKGSLGYDRFHELWNACEDMRMERHVMQRFPGFARIRNSTGMQFVQEGNAARQRAILQDHNGNGAMMATWLTAMMNEYLGLNLPGNQPSAGLLNYEYTYMRELTLTLPLYAAAASCSTMDAMMPIVRKIYDILFPPQSGDDEGDGEGEGEGEQEGEPEQDEDGDTEGEGGGDGEPTEGEDEGDESGSTEGEGDDESESESSEGGDEPSEGEDTEGDDSADGGDAEGDESDDTTEGEGGEGGESEGGSDAEGDEDEGESEDSEADDDGGEGAGEGESEQDDSEIDAPTEGDDDEGEDSDPSDDGEYADPTNLFEEGDGTLPEDVTVDVKPGAWRKFVDSSNRQFGRIIRGMLQKNEDTGRRRRLSFGDVDLKRWDRVRTEFDYNVFQRRIEPDSPRYALIISVDTSGSMGGRKETAALQAAATLAEAWRSIDLPFTIFGWGSMLSYVVTDRSQDWQLDRVTTRGTAGGGTDETIAVTYGYEVAMRYATQGYQPIWFHLTDGETYNTNQSLIDAFCKAFGKGHLYFIAIMGGRPFGTWPNVHTVRSVGDLLDYMRSKVRKQVRREMIRH